MTTPMQNSGTRSELQASNDYVALDLFYFLGFLWRRKWTIILSGIVCAALAFGISYTRPKLYSAVVRFMPPSPKMGTFVFSLRSSGDEYRAMLTSDAVTADVIEHQHLMTYFKVNDLELAKRVLSSMAKFDTDQNNFITITVNSKEPETSVRIANEYYAALYRLSARIAQDESAHRLDYMSGPLQIERVKLAAAEDALRDAEIKTGLVVPATQATLGVQQISNLQDRISALETQLAAAREGATDENPRVVALQSQINSLHAQIATLEGTGSTQSNSPAHLPQKSLEVERAQREVTFHVSTLDALNKALASSSMQENYTPSFALIDAAILHKNKVAPQRKKWLLVGGLLGLVLGFLWVTIPYLRHEWLESAAGKANTERWRRAVAGMPRASKGNA